MTQPSELFGECKTEQAHQRRVAFLDGGRSGRVAVGTLCADHIKDGLTVGLRPVSIDDDPRLLDQSYQLRYQVYCLERKFLSAGDYPDSRESDSFDADSVHVGVVNDHGELAATARIVRPGGAGLPLFRHCTLFPMVTTFAEAGNRVVEISRVSISRHYSRRRDDIRSGGPGGPVGPLPDAGAWDGARDRRDRLGGPFLTLLKAIIHAAKRLDATHLIFAIEPALQRWLVHYGFPTRLAGPEVEYYGPVAPYIMSLAELDQVVLAGQFDSLAGFPVGPHA